MSSNNYENYFSVNYDYEGRKIENAQEFVSFYSNSTVRIWPNNELVGYDSHWHNALEIIMPIENHYDVNSDGKFYHLLPNEILVIPPGILHELIAPAEGGLRFIYLFDISLIRKLKGFASIDSILAHPLYVKQDTYPSIYSDIHSILEQMQKEYFGRTEYSELTIYSLILDLLVKFGYNRIQNAEFFPNTRDFKQKEYIQKFNDLMDFIDAHYAEDLTLADIAERVGYSKYHFSRLFKQYTGDTYSNYLVNKRLKIVEELLSRPELNILEVSMQAGFPSISTFNRIFKQFKGCSPSEYRTMKVEPSFMEKKK